MSLVPDSWRFGNRPGNLCLVGLIACLMALMGSLLAVACYRIVIGPAPEMTWDERLEQMGVADEATYRAMPVERQIEILVELEPYFAHNSLTRSWMQRAIIEKGQEAVEPVVETMQGLANREDISTREERAIRALAFVLGSIHLSNRANLKGTDAQIVLEQVAATSKINKYVRWYARRNLYRILCDKSPPVYPEEPDLTCAE